MVRNKGSSSSSPLFNKVLEIPAYAIRQEETSEAKDGKRKLSVLMTQQNLDVPTESVIKLIQTINEIEVNRQVTHLKKYSKCFPSPCLEYTYPIILYTS